MRNVNALGEFCASIGWRLPGLRRLASKQPLIAIYHSVSKNANPIYPNAEDFERHMLFCKEHFRFLSAEDYAHDREAADPIEILLTFDDGMRNHFDVVAPILHNYNIPAVFFVCSRHSQTGKYLWFTYRQMLLRFFPYEKLLLDGHQYDMRPPFRTNSVVALFRYLHTLEPYPSALYKAIDERMPKLEDFVEENVLQDQAAGMTAQQVKQLASESIFRIGVHTVDHPYLTRCTREEMRSQIISNRQWVETSSAKRCGRIAYPAGDYNAAVIEACSELEIDFGFAVERRPTNWKRHEERPLEIPRVGVYKPSLNVLGFKCQWGDVLRRTRFKFG